MTLRLSWGVRWPNAHPPWHHCCAPCPAWFAHSRQCCPCSSSFSPEKISVHLPLASKHKRGSSWVKSSGREEGNFEGGHGPRGVESELWGDWLEITSTQQGLRGASIALSTLRPSLIVLSLLFHFLLTFYILKLCRQPEESSIYTILDAMESIRNQWLSSLGPELGGCGGGKVSFLYTTF